MGYKEERTPEQIAAKQAQRKAWQDRKARQREREKDAEETYTRSKNREQFWNYNRAKLSSEELQVLKTKETEFLGLWGSVQDVIDNLNKPNVKIGPHDGLPYPDALYQEVEEYVIATGNCRIVNRCDDETFSRVHHPETNPKIREMLYSLDPDWYQFGIFTRFTHATLRQFTHAVAAFIEKYPNHPDIDSAVAQQIIIEARGNVPAVQVPSKPEPITETERQIHERLNASFTTPPIDWQL